MIILAVSACDEQEQEGPFELQAEKVSDSQIHLTWNAVAGADEYKIWRVINNGGNHDPEVIGIAEASAADYFDQDLPLSPSLIYHVTTNVEGKEKKSNDAEVDGAAYLPILPYQMELLPGEFLAIVRDYSDIFLVDYERGTIKKKTTFQGKVGKMGLRRNGDTWELFVPCTDNNLYILKADDLTPIDMISTGKPLAAVAINGLGTIFCSGNFDDGKIRLYNRSTLSLIGEAPAGFNCGLTLQNNNNLITVSSGLHPATMSYYTFSDEGVYFGKTDDPYSYDYEMQAERLSVSDHYIVTATEGFIYSADASMTHIGTIRESGELADFEFAADGSTIYSTVTNQRQVLKSTINNGVVSSSGITTQGYPWVLSRDGNTLVVLSSPDAFSLSSVTNRVIIDKIALEYQ